MRETASSRNLAKWVTVWLAKGEAKSFQETNEEKKYNLRTHNF